MDNIILSTSQARDILEDKKSEIERLLLEGLEKALILLESDAKRDCDAIDEGLLRASINHATDENENEIRGRVGTNLEYAPYVHYGTGIYATDGNGRKTGWLFEGDSVKWRGVHFTKGQKPHPFLQSSMDKNRNKLESFFKDATEGLR